MTGVTAAAAGRRSIEFSEFFGAIVVISMELLPAKVSCMVVVMGVERTVELTATFAGVEFFLRGRFGFGTNVSEIPSVVVAAGVVGRFLTTVVFGFLGRGFDLGFTFSWGDEEDEETGIRPQETLAIVDSMSAIVDVFVSATPGGITVLATLTGPVLFGVFRNDMLLFMEKFKP